MHCYHRERNHLRKIEPNLTVLKLFEWVFENSVKITLGKVLGKTAKLLLFVFVVGHSLAMIAILANFDFVSLTYAESQNTSTVYLTCLFLISTTTTTVGYGIDTESRPENLFLVMLLEFSGIVFYGYAFQQMMAILSMTKTYDETIEDRNDRLDKWLIDRQKHVTSTKNSKVIEMTRDAFEFIWKWDIENIFSHEFFWEISPNLRTGILEGPTDFVVSKFSSFFSAIKNKELLMKLVHEMRPKQYSSYSNPLGF